MAATASSEQRIDLVREFNEAVFNGRDYDRMEEFQTEDFVQHGPMAGMEVRGIEEAIQNMKVFHEAFSDLEGAEEFSFSDGEYVCTYYTYRGTHDGEFMGIPPTGKRAEVPGIVVNRFEEDKPTEAWVVVDFLALVQQLELVPPIDEMAG
jgi:steroid delta-isomerase-like uncharacterized protein